MSEQLIMRGALLIALIGCAHAAPSTPRRSPDWEGTLVAGALFFPTPVNARQHLGAYVRYVVPESPAAKIGLVSGDSVIAISSRVVHDPGEVASVLSAEIESFSCKSIEVLRSTERHLLRCPGSLQPQLDSDEIRNAADSVAPVALVVMDTNSRVRQRVNMKGWQYFDASGLSVVDIMKRISPVADEISAVCVQTTGPVQKVSEGDCAQGAAIPPHPLARDTSYKVLVHGNEYRSREFFSEESVFSLRLKMIVKAQSANGDVIKTSFQVTDASGTDECFVRTGDVIGLEKMKADVAHGECMVLRQDESEALLCLDPRP